MKYLLLILRFAFAFSLHAQVDTVAAFEHQEFSWGITVVSDTKNSNNRRKSCGEVSMFIKKKNGENLVLPFFTHLLRSYHSLYTEYPDAIPIVKVDLESAFNFGFNDRSNYHKISYKEFSDSLLIRISSGRTLYIDLPQEDKSIVTTISQDLIENYIELGRKLYREHGCGDVRIDLEAIVHGKPRSNDQPEYFTNSEGHTITLLPSGEVSTRIIKAYQLSKTTNSQSFEVAPDLGKVCEGNYYFDQERGMVEINEGKKIKPNTSGIYVKQKGPEYREIEKTDIASYKNIQGLSLIDKFTLVDLYECATNIKMAASEYPTIERLFLRPSERTGIPVEIGQLNQLYEIDSKGYDVGAIPESFKQLKQLHSLTIENSASVSFPESIGEMNNLSWIRLNNCNLTQIPEEIFTMTGLSTLDVTNNDISSISDDIGKMYNLSRLEINYHPDMVIPESLINWAKGDHQYRRIELIIHAKTIRETKKAEKLIDGFGSGPESGGEWSVSGPTRQY